MELEQPQSSDVCWPARSAQLLKLVHQLGCAQAVDCGAAGLMVVFWEVVFPGLVVFEEVVRLPWLPEEEEVGAMALVLTEQEDLPGSRRHSSCVEHS